MNLVVSFAFSMSVVTGPGNLENLFVQEGYDIDSQLPERDNPVVIAEETDCEERLEFERERLKRFERYLAECLNHNERIQNHCSDLNIPPKTEGECTAYQACVHSLNINCEYKWKDQPAPGTCENTGLLGDHCPGTSWYWTIPGPRIRDINFDCAGHQRAVDRLKRTIEDLEADCGE